MADLSDVVDGIAVLLWSAFYPNGAGTASALGGTPVKIKPGWPLAGDLDAEVGAVKDVVAQMDRGVYVSIFPPPNLERATTRAMAQWLAVSPPTKPLTVAISGASVTLGGSPAIPQNLALVIDGRGFAYVVQAGDTLASLAWRIAADLAANGVPASASGPVLAIPGAKAITSRVGSIRRMAKEVERTQRVIITTVWAPTPALRAQAGRIVRARLADTSDLPNAHNRFLPLSDGSAAWIVYDRTNDWDQDQRAGLYRRDISHWFEFGEYATTEATEVILAEVSVGGTDMAGRALAPPRSTFT